MLPAVKLGLAKGQLIRFAFRPHEYRRWCHRRLYVHFWVADPDCDTSLSLSRDGICQDTAFDFGPNLDVRTPPFRCEDRIAQATRTRTYAVGCRPARSVVASWQRSPTCSGRRGRRPERRCAVSEYRCNARPTHRSWAVHCVRQEMNYRIFRFFLREVYFVYSPRSPARD